MLSKLSWRTIGPFCLGVLVGSGPDNITQVLLAYSAWAEHKGASVLDAYVIWTLQDAMTKHERRIHDAGKKYAQHVQSVDPQIVNQAEQTFLHEMRDSIGEVLVEMLATHSGPDYPCPGT